MKISVRIDSAAAQAQLRRWGGEFREQVKKAVGRALKDEAVEIKQDHLNRAIEVLKRKVARHALPLHLMPTNFTMTALQRACEAILGLTLDKSVFRRRLKADLDKRPPEIPDLVEVPGATETGHQRPAQLYKAREGFVFLE